MGEGRDSSGPQTAADDGSGWCRRLLKKMQLVHRTVAIGRDRIGSRMINHQDEVPAVGRELLHRRPGQDCWNVYVGEHHVPPLLRVPAGEVSGYREPQ